MEITVLGRAEYVVAPESGLITVSIEVEAGTQREAAMTASGLVSEVAAAIDLLAAGGGPVSWRAVGPLTTSSWRPYEPSGEPQPPRHAASARVQARFTDVPALASFIAEWGVRECYHMQGVIWELSDDTRAHLDQDALARAVEDSRRRAQVIARAAGADQVEAIAFRDPSISLGHPEPHPMMRMAMSESAHHGGGPSPLVADDITGTVTIEARYATT